MLYGLKKNTKKETESKNEILVVELRHVFAVIAGQKSDIRFGFLAASPLQQITGYCYQNDLIPQGNCFLLNGSV